MPRVYVRKRETNYTIEDIQRAVKDVEDKKKTYRQAEDFYNVPIAVIYHRIKGRKIDINKMGAGVSKVLSDRVERYLVSCLKVRAQMGKPVLKEELKSVVKEYVEIKNIKTPFKDNKPGDDWYTSFMKRHPELSLKKPEHLQKARKDARKPHVVYGFYDLLNDVVQKNNLGDKPMYIYNCDKSGFQSDPSKMRAIGQKGKPLYRVSGGSGRESTTVLACVSADGLTLPPLIVFKGAAVQARWTSENSFPGTLYGATKNGWMEESVFFSWLTKSFICHVNTLRQERNEPNQKALLIYDGHSSHISVRIIEEAENSNIELLKFPSHLTDRIQPLDKCVFGPVKKTWDQKLIEYGVKQMGKGSGRLTRTQFAELLGEVYVTALKTTNIISGFTTTGIYPVDPSKFPKNLFNTEDLKLYNALLNNDQVERPQLTPEIDVEQLGMERYFRENLQTATEEAQQSEMRNKQTEIVQIENSGIEAVQTEMQNEKIDIHPDKIRQKDTYKHLESYNKSPEKRQMVIDHNIITQETKKQKINEQVKTPEIDIEIENNEMQLEKKEKEIKQVDMPNAEIVEINTQVEQFHAKDIYERQTIHDNNIHTQPNEEIYSQETEMEQVVMQNEDLDTQKQQVSQTDKNVHVEADREKRIEMDTFKNNNERIETQLEEDEEHDTCTENNVIEKQRIGSDKKYKRKEPINTCLINNIMKMISLDTITDSETKNKIVSALIITMDSEKCDRIPEQSPNKDTIQKIFGVCATPEKAKKLVVPRLKQSAFGEILTCEEVKKRLRLAEEKKVKTKKNNTEKLMDITNRSKVSNNKNTMKKDKGKGKKTKATTKKETNKKNITKSKNKKRKVESEDSESDIVMSTHSDSDIADVVSDDNGNDYDKISLEEKNLQCNTINPTPTCTSPVAGSSKPEETVDIIHYNIHDNVLVRYILKKKVEYFVGKIINKINDNYMISFYKRVGKNDNTKFIVSKKDIYRILPNMIVKNVNLLVINEKETKFVFMDDEDSVYFD